MSSASNDNKHNVLRIFPFLRCNYKCNYCTAYTQYNKPIDLKREMLSAKDWLKAINVKNLYDTFDNDFRVIISGGEPGLYKELPELCDGIEHRNIYLYSNVSRQVFQRLLLIKKQVVLYPSFHVKQELKDGSNFKEWFQRTYELKQKGHKIMMPHSPNDGSLGNLPVLKTRIENKNYSPYVNECRINGLELKEVQCFTQQFVIDSAGEIFNCQSGLWSNDKSLSLGNIKTTKWSEIPEWFGCDQCGNCHPCSQSKALKGIPINNEWQLKFNEQIRYSNELRNQSL